MKYSTRLSNAIHILSLIALNQESTLTSEQIAFSAKSNPAQVRRHMSTLKKAGIIDNTVGHPLPMLARDAREISLFEVYKAIEGDTPLLHLDTQTNPECGKGILIQDALKDYYNEIQKVAEDKMKTISLQDIVDTYQDKLDMLNFK